MADLDATAADAADQHANTARPGPGVDAGRVGDAAHTAAVAAGPATRPSGPDGSSDGSLDDLVRLAVDLRLILLLVAMMAVLIGGADRRVLLPMAAASVAGVALLVWWEHVIAVLRRHPALFTIDVVVTIGIVMMTGVDGPFVLYTVSTAFLAGVLYGYVGGALFGGSLAAVQVVAALGLMDDVSFVVALGLPVIIVVAGLGAAAIRNLLLRTAGVERELQAMTGQRAAAEERARLAREMHDTLGKTLHGISLAAAALPMWVERRPADAGAKARQVAEAAEIAAKEARQLIGDLRSDSFDQPLHLAISDWGRDWSRTSGVRLSLAVSPLGPISASSRYELFTILREALRNVGAHSGATSVSVYLAQDGASAVLEVVDDGRGLEVIDLEQLAAEGHYGLVGMQERARRAGGRVILRSGGRGRGTTIRAEVPMTSAHDMVSDTPSGSGGRAGAGLFAGPAGPGAVADEIRRGGVR